MDVKSINALPDFPALRQVQEALWKIGEVHGAAVMIGAGFSRFADLAAATTLSPPLWNDFRDEMLGALYPPDEGPSDPLILAEEYRAALGEQALDNLIRSRIRDAEWKPGPLHKRLLQLPWADVLTTNWDTLLERSADADPDHAFDVVRVTSDIARTRSPRIVKLHGSMPSHGPFIFSEEDFRTYPQRYAPFVNLAQQVLLENELCLLGFSGEDPNFLQWAGWVRDKLGTAARPIRLVGVLNLSPSRRRLLERRNITPIDLAPLVAGAPAEDRHRRATEIFLESLLQARPKTQAEWVRTREKDYGLGGITDTDAKLQRLAEVWAEERTKHPGWLVTPSHERERGRYDTHEALVALSANLDKVSAPVRIAVLFETVWRWETLFWTIPDFIEKAVHEATAANQDLVLSENRQVLLRAAIVRSARHRRDWPAFDERLAQLEALANTEARSEAAFERCLRARDEIDYQYIASHCAEVGGSDPVWLLRRASLLAEILDGQGAARTIHEAYEEIRRRRAQDRRGLWLLSREAWASWLLRNARFELDDLLSGDDAAEWPLAYKAAKTDPWDELQSIDYDLEKAASDKRKATREREPLFDPGAYRVRSRGTRWRADATTSPYGAVVHLAEKVGIPLQLGSVSLLDDRYARSIDVGLDDDHNSAWAAIRSILSYDRNIIDTRFSRVAVARLPLEIAEDMVTKLCKATDFGRDQLARSPDNGVGASWASRVRSLTELLSRLSLRFEGDAALELFRFGAALLSDPSLTHWWALEGIGNLLRRSLQAVEPARRGEAALDVLLLPLPSEKQILGNERDFPEVSDCLDVSDWSVRTQTHPWSSRIATLINIIGNNKHHQSRQQAVFRLLKLFEAGALTHDEEAAFGKALWQHTEAGGQPADTNLLGHVFLRLPCPDPELPRRAFETTVVQKLVAGKFTHDLLRALQGASYTLKAEYAPYQLDAADALAILDKVLALRGAPGNRSRTSAKPDFEDDRLADAAAGALASTVISSLAANEIGSERCIAIFRLIASRTMPSLLKALPSLIRVDPLLSDEALKAIRNGLLSQDSGVVVSALTAIFWLCRFARDGGSDVPPLLVAETVSLCLMRREAGLISALRTARMLVVAGYVTEDDRRRLVEALELIQAETSYEHWDDEDRRSDVSLIRRAAVRLASALKEAGVAAPCIDAWMAEAAADPIPEVRYALAGDDDDD